MNLGAVFVTLAKLVAMVDTFQLTEGVQGLALSSTFAIPMYPRYGFIMAMHIGESY